MAKPIEQALRESEARLSSVVNSAPMILWSLDRNGVFTFSEGRALAALGLAAGDVVGRSVFDVYSEVPKVLSDARRALAGEEFTSIVQIGGVVFETRYSNLRDKGGSLAGVISIATDVTERTRAEEELKKRERQLANTQQLAKLGSWDWDIPGNSITWSEELYRIYGLEPEEFVPTYDGYLQRVHPNDRERVRAELGKAYRTGLPFNFEERILRPDGAVRVLRSFGTVSTNAAGKPVRLVGACQDVTDRKEAEETLRSAEKRARDVAKRMRAVTAAAAGLTATWTVEELERTLREACSAVISFDTFSILFYDEVTHSFAYCGNMDDGVWDPAGTIAVAGTPAERVVRERRSLVTLRSDDPASHGARLVGTGKRSESAIRSPILRGEAVLGVLSAQSYTPNLYTDQDFEVFDAIASLAATAIANIRLLSERRAAEAALQQAHDELERRVEERTAELAATNRALEAQIAERAQAEKALRKSEERFRSLIENGSDVISVLNADGTILYESPSIERVLGHRQEALIGKSAFELVHPDDVAPTAAVFAQVFENPGQAFRAEFRFRHLDGSWRTLEAVGKTLLPDNAAEGVVVSSRDVTERREIEAALREREEYFRRLTESSHDLVQVLGPEGNILYTGPSVQRLLGYTPEEIQGGTVPDFIHPDDQSRAAELMMSVLATPGVSRSLEYRVRHKSGSWRWFEVFARTLSPKSAEEGLVANARDITERKEAEAALQRSEEHFRRLIENAYDMVLVMDTAGTITYASPSAQRVLGSAPEELTGLSGFSLLHPDDGDTALARTSETVATPGLVLSAELRLRHRDGSYRVLETFCRTVDDDSAASGIVVNGRDVTERKQIEEEAERAREAAERANRAKSEFLSRMSHELRTPMNSILGFAQLLARKELPGDQKKGVDHILKAGRHLLNLINEVLDITRIEANRQQLSIEPVQVRSALQEALSLIRPLAAQRECRIDDQVTAAAELYVRADRQRLTQVLLNLLSNAVKYNRPGGSVRVSCTAAEGQIRIGVHDNGAGIPADKMDQLFVPFARLGAEQSGIEGTGLGLALSKRLVEAMEGQLEVKSTPGEGSTFMVELPQGESPMARLVREGSPAPRPAELARGKPATVLYIEDNLANLSLVESILAARPEITLLPALQGRLGLDLAWEHRPDLVLLDLHLPDIPGEEVLRYLKSDARTRHTPVIIISADATPGTVERLLQEGADGYLTKPLDVDQFLGTIQTMLNQPAS
ncbi:hypothetical protein BH23GEM5_BH23GEM5_03390 [soil metagenome]